MGTVIYSASPFQTLLGSLGPVLFIFGIGLVGIGMAIFRPNQKPGTRLLTVVLGIFLIIVSFVTAAITLNTIARGSEKVSVNIDNKRVVEDNCGDNGETCTRYVLETISGQNAYDFNVIQDVYNQAQVNACYEFTFYPNKGLFTGNSPSYQQINNIARIETADPSTCQ